MSRKKKLWKPRSGEWVVVPKGTPIYYVSPKKHGSKRPYDQLAGRTYKVQAMKVHPAYSRARFVYKESDNIYSQAPVTRLIGWWVGWQGSQGMHKWADLRDIEPVPSDLELLSRVELT